METKKSGLDYNNQAIQNQLNTAIAEIKKRVTENNLIVEGDLSKLENLNFQDATRSSKKKLAKKIYYFLKAGTRRKMNAMLAFISRKFLSSEKKIVILPSLEQQAIEKARKDFKEQLKIMLEKKEEYKKLKQSYKEKGGMYL